MDKSDLEFARWQGGVTAQLDALLSRVDHVASSKDTAHAAINARIDAHAEEFAKRTKAVEDRIDLMESWRDEFRGQLRGLLVGCVVGAGAVGGGAGAIVSSLLT